MWLWNPYEPPFEAVAASQEFGRIKTPCLSRDTCEHGANNGADFYHATLKSVHPVRNQMGELEGLNFSTKIIADEDCDPCQSFTNVLHLVHSFFTCLHKYDL